jgi:hypothetical protein
MRVVLISWSPDPAEAVAHLRPLAEQVDVVAPKGPADLKALAADPPAAFVLDLDRRPSEGLVIGIHLRRQPATRRTPQVFAGGEGAKVARVRAILPDARYSDWEAIATQLRTAIERPPDNPVVPEAMAPYADSRSSRNSGSPAAPRSGSSAHQTNSQTGSKQQVEPTGRRSSSSSSCARRPSSNRSYRLRCSR